MTSVRIRETYSRWVRWSHWLNVPLLLVMIWSGLLIYWANPEYIPFPQSIAKPLKMDYRLAEGMGWHFFLMWPFALNGLIYGIYLAWSREWREIVPLKRAPGEEPSKLSREQQFAYTGVLLLGAFTVVTGIAIYKPVQASWLTELLGGYPAARFEHFLCMCGLVLFTFVHVVQVMRAGWNTFRSMVAGYEVVDKGEKREDT